MDELERFGTLVHTVYEGATNVAAWPNILTAAAEWLDADKAILLTPYLVPEQGGFAHWHRIEESDVTLWATRYARDNIWAQKLEEKQLLKTGAVLTGPDMLPDQELLRSVWYREFLSRADIFQALVGIVFGKEETDYPVCAFTLFRGVCASPFDDLQQKKLRLLTPHLSRSLGVMFKLRDAEFRVAASLHALNQIHTGILLLDAEGRVSFANNEAERMCGQQDGLRLKAGSRSRSTLYADDSIVDATLRHVLRSTVRMRPNDVEHFAHAILVPRRSGLPGFSVQASALPESNPYQQGSDTPRAIVFIKDSAQSHMPDVSFLMLTYGLTQAESRLALALSDGGSLESVSQQLQVGVNTLKSQLKGVYAKTSVNNRAALTKVLLSLGSR